MKNTDHEGPEFLAGLLWGFVISATLAILGMGIGFWIAYS